MTRNVSVPLESYELVRRAGQIPCFICGDANTHEAEFCNRCLAPMALAHQAVEQKLRPQMVGIIGASGVGKTVYLGMLLDMLSRGSTGMKMLARGAFSISLQQQAVGALARCEFPDKTPNEPDRWNWVHCQVDSPRRRRPIDLVVPDMAGEALLEEIDHPHSYRVVRRFLASCTGALVLVDAAGLRRSREQDYFAMKLLTHLAEMDDSGSRSWRNKPVGLVLTKADQCEPCFDDPAEFARTHAAGLWQHCQQRFKRFKFFASGVAGTCAYRESFAEPRMRVPLRIEPRGIVEPFEWLVNGLKG